MKAKTKVLSVKVSKLDLGVKTIFAVVHRNPATITLQVDSLSYKEADQILNSECVTLGFDVDPKTVTEFIETNGLSDLQVLDFLKENYDK